MSKSIIGEHQWAEMTEVQKVEAVHGDPSALKQLTHGFLSSADTLRNARRNSHRGNPRTSHKNTGVAKNESSETGKVLKQRKPSKKKDYGIRAKKPSHRFGLPAGFSPRLHHSGRSLLIEENLYSLPGGQEYIPKHPTGTLGKQEHLYALLTLEQFEGGRRGSVYVRNDGRIFDYSVDHADPSRDMFDTGYTISDLERTGRYAPMSETRRGKKKV
jgi:hypothetical protein